MCSVRIFQVLAVFCLAAGQWSVGATDPVKPLHATKDASGPIIVELPATGRSSYDVELRINEKGELLDKAKVALKTTADISRYLQSLHEEAKKQAAKVKGKESAVEVILRGPRGDHLKPAIKEITQLAEKVGFASVRIVREPELPVEVTLLMKSTKDGALEQVVVTRVGQKPVTLSAEKWEEALGKHLQTLRKNMKNKEEIQSTVESQLKYLFVVGVVDVCLKAGFEAFSFTPPPDTSK
ncbi:MAG: hypothetical protein K2R98_07125 [Gemmataceae bacterium]|nr:hypothetical protein [Gemmataceae bacterium]